MDIRVLEYFLTVARLESITKAAQYLNMTQPPLSRQLKELEEELGTRLFIRGSRRITLTDEGIILRKRAEEITLLMEKTISEITSTGEDVSGNIYIGGGETHGMSPIARAIQKIQAMHPHIQVHIFSGNAGAVTERLDRGLLDFGVYIEPANMENYNYIRLADTDVWGLLMRKDSPLAAKKSVSPTDLADLPLICSSQEMVDNQIAGWMGKNASTLNIVATYNLLFNASLMVSEGLSGNR